MSYYDEITKAMSLIAENEKSIFIGQSVIYGGQAMHGSLKNVPMDQRIEMPVAEDMQMGMCTGLAMQGFLPVCIYPRIDFMLLCLNQLVNHLDKMQPIPKMIIRTAIGSRYPMNPGPQHTQDHTIAFQQMLHHIPVIRLTEKDDIMTHYQWALNQHGPVMLVEYVSQYGH